MKIYTKKGDQGKTSLLGGSRVNKYHVRIEAYGTVDELNSHIGVLRDISGTEDFVELLTSIQSNLFTLGSILASDPEKSSFKLPEISEQAVSDLETSMDAMEAELPELKNFILPGGHPASSAAHICRTVCRRAERRVVQLGDSAEVPEIILKYLNRLSDWFFVLARMILHKTGNPEITWKP